VSPQKPHQVLRSARVPVVALPDPGERLLFGSPWTPADIEELGFRSLALRVTYPLAILRFRHPQIETVEFRKLRILGANPFGVTVSRGISASEPFKVAVVVLVDWVTASGGEP
jgi:hypothetical protein